MKYTITFLFLFFLICVSRATDRISLFNHQLNNAEGRSIEMVGDSAVYFLGYAEDSAGNTNVVLTRLDLYGNTIWWHSYPDSGINLGLGLCVNSRKELVIVGEKISNGNTDFEVMSVDTMGNLLWRKSYGTAYNESIQFVTEAPDGNYMACGYATQADLVSNDILVVKFDTVGNVVWQNKYGTQGNDYGKMLQFVSAEKVAVSGDSHNGRDVDNALLIIDSSGIELNWATVGDANDNGNQSLMINHEGKIILCGESTTSTSTLFDIYLAAFDTNGVSLWSRYIGGDGSDAGFAIAENSTHEYFITGYSSSPYLGAPYTAYLQKLDEQFHPVGLKYFPQADLTICYDEFNYNDSLYLLSGTSGNNFCFISATDSGWMDNFTEHNVVAVIEHKSTPVFDARVFCKFNKSIVTEINQIPLDQELEISFYDVSGQVIGSIPITKNRIETEFNTSEAIILWTISKGNQIFKTGKVFLY